MSIFIPTTTLAQALADAPLGVTRLEAQLLMLHTLGKSAHERAWLLTHGDERLSKPAVTRFKDACQRRAGGEPLAYITGEKEFFGLRLQVDPRVLDPRADTETLVDWGLQQLLGKTSPLVLDLGTGSGAAALALAQGLMTRGADARVFASDISDDALAVAQRNARRLGLTVSFGQGSWFESSLPAQRYDLIVSNPPYVAIGDPHLAALTHEPLQALVSGADGLDALRHIVAHASAYLQPEGWLLLEHGYDQAAAVRQLLVTQGFEQVQSRQDLQGIERCSGGRLADQ